MLYKLALHKIQWIRELVTGDRPAMKLRSDAFLNYTQAQKQGK